LQPEDKYNLQYIDMQSTRNLAVIGISIMVGLMIPFWAMNNPKALQTGKTFLYYIRNVTKPENCENRYDPDLVHWWIESDFKASLRM
jgi:hypothetical protein